MYMTIEALADGGVMAGLTRELATTMAAQTMMVRKGYFDNYVMSTIHRELPKWCWRIQNSSWRGEFVLIQWPIYKVESSIFPVELGTLVVLQILVHSIYEVGG